MAVMAQPKSSSTSTNIQQSQNPPPLPPRLAEAAGRNFENNAFADLDDGDEYSSKNLGKMRISSPLRIENANMPPINFYPTLKRHNYPSFL